MCNLSRQVSGLTGHTLLLADLKHWLATIVPVPSHVKRRGRWLLALAALCSDMETVRTLYPALLLLLQWQRGLTMPITTD
jgi:hypothetical protein